MRRSAWERAFAFASNRSCSPFSFTWQKTPAQKNANSENSTKNLFKDSKCYCPSVVPLTHSKRRKLLFINADDVRNV